MLNLLQVNRCSVEYRSEHGTHQALKHISFHLKAGEALALVGESGSGKSTAALAIMGLLPKSATVSGSVLFHGDQMLNRSNFWLNSVRGQKVAMIFQNPMTSLHPFLKVKTQLLEQILKHSKLTRKAALAHAISLLTKVGIDDAKNRINQYPHQFSGGMRQRVMIAMAISCKPDLLIADEPTTALDSTTQVLILSEIKALLEEFKMGLLIVSHDLGVVKNICDHIVVMKSGKIVEKSSTQALFSEPKHAYTRELLAAIPRLDEKPVVEQCKEETVLKVEQLNVRYQSGNDEFVAVNGIDFELRKGEILAIAGESGSGKSSTLRALTGLVKAEGDAQFKAQNLLKMSRKESKVVKTKIQMIFQDPYSSLNPRWRIKRTIAEPLKNLLKLSAKQQTKRIDELCDLCGIDKAFLKRFPHELSGGQRQRIGIARALASNPEILLCDEPVSALDVIIQKQIIELLKDLQQKLNLSIIFVSHDLSVIYNLCSRVIIMHKGEIVEHGPTEEIFSSQKQAYTQKLVSSIYSI